MLADIGQVVFEIRLARVDHILQPKLEIVTYLLFGTDLLGLAQCLDFNGLSTVVLIF